MYGEMLNYVEKYLSDNDGQTVKIRSFPFRKRSEHIKRVFMWAERLIEDQPLIDKEAVLTAAIFHDVGYAIALEDFSHAKGSAAICEKYLTEKGFEVKFIDFVVYLVKSHSNKQLMSFKDTPLELILLMEADLLDETGALSIIWDAMVEGSEKIQTFEKTYNHILKYSFNTLNRNPMVTTKGKMFWENKQSLMKEFIRELAFDLGIENSDLEEYKGLSN